MANYKVMREHHGDRHYRPGDQREADPGQVAHLLARGVLAPASGKAAAPLENKAAPPVANKAGAAPRGKTGQGGKAGGKTSGQGAA